MPATLGTKIIPIGQMRAAIWASWPAPLGMRTRVRFKPSAARSIARWIFASAVAPSLWLMRENVIIVRRYEAMETIDKARRAEADGTVDEFERNEAAYSCLAQYVARAISVALFGRNLRPSPPALIRRPGTKQRREALHRPVWLSGQMGHAGVEHRREALDVGPVCELPAIAGTRRRTQATAVVDRSRERRYRVPRS